MTLKEISRIKEKSILFDDANYMFYACEQKIDTKFLFKVLDEKLNENGKFEVFGHNDLIQLELFFLVK